MQQQQLRMQQQAAQQQAQVQAEKNQILHGSNRAKVEAAQVAADGKVRAEEVEQTGKREYEDHKFTRDLDRMVMEEDGVEQPQAPSQAQGDQLMQIKEKMGQK